jgi:hypothetical protein
MTVSGDPSRCHCEERWRRSNPAFARKIEFLEPVQAVSTCPVPPQKILRFMFHPNQFHNSRRLTPLEGRIAIVTDAGWMRWTRMRF